MFKPFVEIESLKDESFLYMRTLYDDGHDQYYISLERKKISSTIETIEPTRLAYWFLLSDIPPYKISTEAVKKDKKKLGREIEKACNEIAQKTRRGKGNRLFVGVESDSELKNFLRMYAIENCMEMQKTKHLPPGMILIGYFGKNTDANDGGMFLIDDRFLFMDKVYKNYYKLIRV